MSLNKVLEAKEINGCPALALAVEGWNNLLQEGLADTAIIFSYSQSVLWVEDGGQPVGVIVWEYYEYRKELWINLSYVKAQFRGKGYFRQLYNRLLEIAIEKKALRIAGATHVDNKVMQDVALRCGRTAQFITYSQLVPQHTENNATT